MIHDSRLYFLKHQTLTIANIFKTGSVVHKHQAQIEKIRANYNEHKFEDPTHKHHLRTRTCCHFAEPPSKEQANNNSKGYQGYGVKILLLDFAHIPPPILICCMAYNKLDNRICN
jgi:hypothetical protein